MPDYVSSILNQIQAIQSDLDRELDAFVRSEKKRPVACPSGCGKCCLKFDPDVTAAEALRIADWILRSGNEAVRARVGTSPDDGTCVFYDADNPFHCSVYEARPIVCRGFGFSTFADKTERDVFTFCKHMPTNGPRTLDEKAMDDVFSLRPPRLSDFGLRTETIDPKSSARVKLSIAIGPAFAKVAMLRRLDESPETSR